MQQNLVNLRLQAISGVKWNLAGQILVYIITLVGTVILSRIITPSEYGIFGMIAVITNLASMIVGLGVPLAVIQDKTLTTRDISSLFWLNIIIGTLVGMIIFAGAPIIAKFYNQPELVFATRLFSIVFLFHAAKSVPTGILSKKTNFKYLAYGQIIANVVSFAIAVGLALYDFGVISLVIQAIVLQLLVFIFNLYYADWYPLFILKKESILKIKYFSLNYLPSQIIDYFGTNLDIVLIGKYMGARNVGLYGKAIALVLLPVSLISQVFNKSFYPIFSKVQDNSDGIRKIYLKSSKMMALVLFPTYILIIILAKEVILLLFGSQWIEAQNLVQVLGVFAIFYSLNSFNETFLLSQGKANWLLKINVIDKIILVLLFVFALQFGIIYFAYAKLFVTIIAFIVKFYFAGLVHKYSIWYWIKSLHKVLAGMILSTFVGLFMHHYFIDAHFLLIIFAVSSSSLIVFTIILHLLKDESLREVLLLLRLQMSNKDSSLNN